MREPPPSADDAFPAGRDATASADVGFRNAQDTGLVIDASGSGNSVTVRLWGTPDYPPVCRAFTPQRWVCGDSAAEALRLIAELEEKTRP